MTFVAGQGQAGTSCGAAPHDGAAVGGAMPVRPSGYGAYQRVQTETASPPELIAMLYDALVKNLARAESGLTGDDFERAHVALVRAQDIMLELIASQDASSEDPRVEELTTQLTALYEYMYQKLLSANVEKNVAPVREVQRLIEPIRQAWAQVMHVRPGAGVSPEQPQG
jgi:flagellar protein FliS